MSEEGVKRRLTTTLAADVVGYSRLMAADEAGRHCQTKNLAIFQSPSGCWKSQVFCAVHRKPGITNST